MRIGPAELIIVLVIALLIWGPAKLPELGRSLGRAISEFNRSLKGEHAENAGMNNSSDSKTDS